MSGISILVDTISFESFPCSHVVTPVLSNTDETKQDVRLKGIERRLSNLSACLFFPGFSVYKGVCKYSFKEPLVP